MGNNNKMVNNPQPAYKVFISSTYEDMKEYRSAAAEALINIQAIPMGMERFTAASQPPIDRCYEEIRQCQFCVSILGFRYGSLCKDTSLSYSELEFNEAERLGIPILVFIREGNLDANRINLDDFSKRERFRNRLQNSASNRLTVTFSSPEDLKDKLTRALQEEIKRNAERKDNSESIKKSDKENIEEYLAGAQEYRKFILMPGEYSNQTVRLRVRFDGNYGTWKLKEELFDAFDLTVGKAIYINDLFVLGVDYSNISEEGKHMDAFAVGDAAKWFLTNNINKGCIIEGDFSLEWRYCKNVAGKAMLQFGASDAYLARLIIKSPNIKLITQSLNTAQPSHLLNDVREINDDADITTKRSNSLSQEEFIKLIQTLL